MTVTRNSDMAYAGSIVTLTPIYTARGQALSASFRNIQMLCFDRITSPWYSEACIARGGFIGWFKHCRINCVTGRSYTKHGLKLPTAFTGQGAEDNIWF
jgi:hypothetical protein